MTTKKLLSDLLKFLGPPYQEKIIDLENCAYRDYGNGFDVEISGNGTKRLPFTIFVWDNRNGSKITERSGPFQTFPELKEELDRLTEKYLQL